MAKMKRREPLRITSFSKNTGLESGVKASPPTIVLGLK
jgi:hypothetical protein